MKDFYLDKQRSFRTWWKEPYRTVAFSLTIALILFAPVWRETVGGRFLLEPQRRAVIRAAVPGQITDVLVDEGTAVEAGAPLLLLRNLRLEAEADDARVHLRAAEAQAREAQMNYTNLGVALAEHESQLRRSRSVLEQVAALEVTSPISGIMDTPRLRDRIGSFVQEGDVMANVEDGGTLKARIFIPEFQMQRIRPSAPTSLKLESSFQPIRGLVASIAPASSELAPGLMLEEKYKGMSPPSYYAATVLLSNADGRMRPGMSGEAKIEVGRESIAGFAWETIRKFLQRKIW